MAQPTPTDLSEQVAESVNDFVNQIYNLLETVILRFSKNFYSSFADVPVTRWTRVILSVVAYIIARPYIEKFFKWTHDRQRKKEKEKKMKAEEERRNGKKAKMSANSLRSGGGGKVLGEVENSDDNPEDDGEEEENLAQASGVPEWNSMARKRQKKYFKNLEKQAYKGAENLSEEQVMELLDWSESEGEQAKKNA